MVSSVIAPPRQATPAHNDAGPPPGGNGFGGFGGGWNSGGGARPTIAMSGVWVGIASIVMLFGALTSAFVIRRGFATSWVRTPLPNIIFLNSAVLLVSSLTLEFSRSSLTAGLTRRFFVWLYTTLILGGAFIAGQLTAWRELVRRGIYLATYPSGSFFYLLTGAHALHLLGGIVALIVLVCRAPKIARGVVTRTLLDGTALYWHFMYALWMYILLLLILKG